MAAHEKISAEQFHMHMYHGTSKENAEKIKAEGLKTDGLGRVFLTHEREVAANWAGFKETNRAIVKVRVNPRNLHVDWNSFEDPTPSISLSAYRVGRNFNSSALRDNDDDWKNSLRQTGSATHLGHIPPKNILEVEHF